MEGRNRDEGSVFGLTKRIPILPEGILYGGDYSPEQWPEDVWIEDVNLMRQAGVNLVNVGIFSWALLEPRSGEFRFDWLGRVIDLLWSNEIFVCLATATASPPAWLVRSHPEMLPVDRNGIRLSPGSRQHYCPSSEAYREASACLIETLVERFSRHPAIVLWHVNNEVGCHVHECFCDHCAEVFRGWLQSRYGSIASLNEAWGTAFWSQTYGAWEEILPPRAAPTFRNPAHELDYARFMSDSLLGILRREIASIRRIAPDAKVTTNGIVFPWPGNYHAWFREMDIAAWDAYPDPAGGMDEVHASAFNHDLIRGVKGGQPFLLMEQATTQVNWRRRNRLKRPGQMRALSYSAIARGSDAVMFFQWRASRAGAEKYHSAMIPHYGTERSRVFREVCALGAELKKLTEVRGTRVDAKVALLVGWENLRAIELESKPTQFDYDAIVRQFHRALWDLNIAVDLLPPDAPIDGYALVVAPALYQLNLEQADRLRDFVQEGGALIMSFFSGVVDAQERIWLGGYPALLQDVFGLAVEEWQPLDEEEKNVLLCPTSDEVACGHDFCELLDLRGAEAIVTYGRDFYAGRAAVTRHRFGAGEAFYLATRPDQEWLHRFFSDILKNRGVQAPIDVPSGVEVSVRQGEGNSFLFLVNHLDRSVKIDLGKWRREDLLTGDQRSGEIELEPLAVLVLRSDLKL